MEKHLGRAFPWQEVLTLGNCKSQVPLSLQLLMEAWWAKEEVDHSRQPSPLQCWLDSFLRREQHIERGIRRETSSAASLGLIWKKNILANPVHTNKQENRRADGSGRTNWMGKKLR